MLVVILLLTAAATGCSKRSSQEPDGGGQDIADLLATSLHHMTRGMEYWYESEHGGFENLTGVPYEDLACRNCHVEPDGCGFCHAGSAHAEAVTPKAPKQDDSDCYGCHGNQFAEVLNGLGDYHRDELGFGCADCHKAADAHGDGNTYNSMHVQGAIKARCSSTECHGTLSSNEFHSYHGSRNPMGPAMECAACHVRSVVTCYNCHFEYEVEGRGKLAYDQITGWKFLLRRDRGDGQLKIDVGNLLAATYEGKAFVAVAPYLAHSVDKNAITDCDDCHNNAYVLEYKETGRISVVTWNDPRGALEPNIRGKGIIPIPPDWRTALRFDFVTYENVPPEPPRWIRMTPSEVGMQMLFAQPLEEMPQ